MSMNFGALDKYHVQAENVIGHPIKRGWIMPQSIGTLAAPIEGDSHEMEGRSEYLPTQSQAAKANPRA
jgi:hypothetical protein